ncbi:peptidylprolyl isomerase [Myxococcota bacterium]|nr:peptidylprolyl isomerase [Myxococcota bacterium]
MSSKLLGTLCSALFLSSVVACKGADPTPPASSGDDPAQLDWKLSDALAGLEGSGTLMAKLETNQGVLVAKLFEAETPKTVANFVGLARGLRPWRDPKSGDWIKRPFYDGLTFHRVIPDFMIQGGDPLGVGTGGPGYRFADEFVPSLRHDKPGRLSMANAGPATNGSQFFVTEVPTPHLDDRHTIFGELVEGLDVVKTIARVPAGPGNRPNEPVVIQKVTIYRQ